MRIIIFLNKLRRAGKLELVESSEEIKQSYLEKSESNLISAKILLENDSSMYNILLSLLFKIGIKSENHSASIILLKEIFGLDNSKLLDAKKERIQTQYYVDFHIKKKDVQDSIEMAEEFNGELLDFISKLTNEQINIYRNKFINILKLNL